MNEFTKVNRADAEVIGEIDGWIDKIREYLRDFFGGEIEQARGTQFGDCVSKVYYLFEIASVQPSKFRGVRDELGRLQAGALVEPYFDYLEIDAFTNAPWNVLKDQPETIKGAATSQMEELVEESNELGFGGRISLIAIERAIVFYTRIGFTQEDDSRSLELIPTAAARFLQRQRNRRRTLNQ